MIWRVAFGVALSAVALSACGSAAHKAARASSAASRSTTASRRSQTTGTTGSKGTTGSTGSTGSAGSTSNRLSYVPVKPTNGPIKANGSPAASTGKNGDITITGNGPRVYGPFKFLRSFYKCTYRQFSRRAPVNFRDIATIFTVTLDRKPGVFDANSLSAIEANQPRGTAGVALDGGRYYVRVGSAAASYSLRFLPSP